MNKQQIMAEWFAAATRNGQANNSWFEVHPNTDEHRAWLGYFGRDLPYTLKNISMNKAQTWTAPCRWPAELRDSPHMRAKFAFLPPEKPPQPPRRPTEAELDAQFKRLGLTHLRLPRKDSADHKG